MLFGLLLLAIAVFISVLAGYISIIGMVALFPAGGLTIILMMGALETGKLIAASWLKLNWKNKRVSKMLRAYMFVAVTVLMTITSIGIFGNLSKFHLEGEAPVAGVEIKISQIESRIKQKQDDRAQLQARLSQFNAQINTVLSTSKSARDANSAQRLQTQQKKERDQITQASNADDAEINTLTDSLAPLKLQISDVSAKLGPLKYVASVFGWTDSSVAVRMIIILLMLVFDPFAVALLLAAQTSIKEWLERRKEKKTGNVVFGPVLPISSVNAPMPQVNLPKSEAVNVPAPTQEDRLEPTQQATELAAQAARRARLYDIPSEAVEPAQAVPEAADSNWSSTVTGSNLPSPSFAGTGFTQSQPFTASVGMAASSLLDDPTSHYHNLPGPKTDQERLMEMLSNNPDIVQQIANVVEADLRQTEEDKANSDK